MNLNTKEVWDNYYVVNKGNLNYPEKFKFISQELLKLPDCSKVLELGCGYGYLLEQIRKDHPTFIIEGLELSEVAVNVVKEKGFVVSEGTAPRDLKKYAGYDAVIATEFLEHLEHEPRLKTLKEIYRMLNKGGKAIFTVPNNILPPTEEKLHLVCFTQSDFKNLLVPMFDFISVTSRSFVVSDKPCRPGHQWGPAPFLFGIGYKK